VKWQLDPTKAPIDTEERVKLNLSMLEMVKADLSVRVKMDWESIYEVANEAEVFTTC
jgi:hypothetical protein